MITRLSLCAIFVLLGCGGEPAAPDAGGRDAGRDSGPAAICERGSDCEDSLFCTEHECRPGDPAADARGCVLLPEGHCAAGEVCDEASDMCMDADCTEPDADTDNHRSFACDGDDCDDTDGNRYAGNVEVCDSEGHDEDCIATTVAGESDGDLDGDGEVSASCCNGATCGTDCDDTNAAINAAASEQCNGVDDNCSGTIDEVGAGDSLCPGGLCTGGRCAFSAWDRVLGGPNGGTTGLTSDDDGNLYVVGAAFGDGADYGAGPTTTSLVASYTADGTLRWVFEYTGDPWLASGVDVAFDRSRGRLYVLGKNLGPIALDTVDVTSTGMFLASFDAAGVPQWVVALPGPASVDARKIAARDGVVVVASAFSGSFDFGDESSRSALGVRDGYVATFDSTGALSWVRTYGRAGANVALDAVSLGADGAVYATGSFQGTVDFGGGDESSAGSSIVALSLDSTGTNRWARTYDSAGDDTAQALEVGDSFVHLAGVIGGTLDFGGGTVGTSGQRSGYLLTLDLAGDYAWARVFQGMPSPSFTTPTSTPAAVAATSDGRVWVVGGFQGTVGFGGGGGLTSSTGDYPGDPNPGNDIFMVLYGAGGVHIRDRALGGTSIQFASTISMGPGGATTVGGQFNDTIDVGSGTRSRSGAWGFIVRTSD